MAYTQTGRSLAIETPLGKDVLLLQGFSGTEAISKPFHFSMELLSANPSINFDTVLGRPATISVKTADGSERYFHGIINRFAQRSSDRTLSGYTAEMVPALWLLTRSADCRIFQNLSVVDIIKKVFSERGLQDVTYNLKSYSPREYCVQYRETDFNFVSRLMEQEGIFYFFKHEDGKHTLVLGDTSSAFPACPHLEQARYLPEAGMGEWEDGVSSYEYRHSVVPGEFVLGDYHFMLSNKGPLTQSEGSSVKIANNSALEVYDYPGEYAQRFNKPDERMGEVEKHGKDMTKWRSEEQAVGHVQISGAATARAFATGHHFKLLGKDGAEIKVPGTDGKYVLTSVKHTIEQTPDYVSGDSAPRPYYNSFACVPHSVPYRPARTTTRPAVHGVQTAVVVGLKDEEIDCDKYGRVKVQFHWDREGKKDEKSSCWVRVASSWAGAQWGMIQIPRIGQEVVVAFLEGDPDQPIIVGSVYNYDNKPPYTLPDNKTQSGIKSRSSKKGKAENFNEIRFEDKKDVEQIYIHAEKNLDCIVENNETRKVGFDKKDKGDQTIEIYNNQTVKIGKAGCEDGSQSLTIYKDRTETIETGNDKLAVKMGNRDAVIEMGNDTLTLKLGNQTTKLNLGKSETEALQSIELKVGQSSLKVDQMGVTIKGMMINIEGVAMTAVKGPMTQVQGTGILQLSGGVMMLG